MMENASESGTMCICALVIQQKTVVSYPNYQAQQRKHPSIPTTWQLFIFFFSLDKTEKCWAASRVVQAISELNATQ